MSKKKKFTPKKKSSPADKMLNVIIAVIIVIFVGLSAWAISPKVKTKIDSIKSEQEAAKPDTISKRADEAGISVEQFISDYGITGDNVNGDTLISDVAENMTLDNYVKLQKTTLEEYISANGLPETVTGDMTVGEANDLIPIKTVIENSGMDFETFKTTYELSDDVTEDTPWSQVQDAVAQKASEMQAAAQEQQAQDSGETGTEASDEAEKENAASEASDTNAAQ